LWGSDAQLIRCTMTWHDGQRRPGGHINDAAHTVLPHSAAYRPAPIDNPTAMSSSLIA